MANRDFADNLPEFIQTRKDEQSPVFDISFNSDVTVPGHELRARVEARRDAGEFLTKTTNDVDIIENTGEQGGDGGDDFVGEGRLPCARWTENPFMVREDDFYITLSAEHYNGIDRVEFTINGGSPVVVREKTPHPDTGYPEYLLPIDVSNLSGGVQDENDNTTIHEVTATIYANNEATPLVLEGDPLRWADRPSSVPSSRIDIRNNDINSFFFRTGSIETITVGPSGQYATINAAFDDIDPRGKRLLLEGNGHRHTSVSPTNFGNRHTTNPVIIEGEDGAIFRGQIGKARRTSWVFKNITFEMEFLWSENNPETGNGSRLLIGDPDSANTATFIGCKFVRVDDDPNFLSHVSFDDDGEVDGGFNPEHPEPWKYQGWRQILENQSNWWGGFFSIRNEYLINKGPKHVTLSKHDSFDLAAQDTFPANPAGVFDFWNNRTIGFNDCIQHDDHVDFFQYFGSFPETEYDGETTRNRMFCDIRGTNIGGQLMMLEGTRRWGTDAIPPTAGDDIVEPSTYEDWYLARWSIESQRTSITGNFSSHILRNITFEDITCSQAGFNIRPQKSADGFRFRNMITHKFRSTLGDANNPKNTADSDINVFASDFFNQGEGTGSQAFEDWCATHGSSMRDNSFENWWVVDQGNGGDDLGPGGGPIDFFDRQPQPVVENPYGCATHTTGNNTNDQEVTWVYDTDDDSFRLEDPDKIDLRTNNPTWNWLNDNT